MKETYNDAMVRVYEDEGGYSNDAGDPGGPTKYGITIHDARMYWKPNATAQDVKNMPKSVAADIYNKHYAAPVHYDELPAGVDYAVFDYGINSGVSRGIKVLQRVVGVKDDGVMGPATLAAVNKKSPFDTVNRIYDERLRFLKSLRTWSIFGKGWGRRVATGRAAALEMIKKYGGHPVSAPTATVPVVVAGTVVAGTTGAVIAAQHVNHLPLFLGGAGLLVAAIILGVVIYRHHKHV